MNRLLYVNGSLVDIDEQTAIGITIQCYDIKKPSENKTSVTNTFTIPKTAKNLLIFGNPGQPFSTSSIVYDALTCNYYVDNYWMLKNAKVNVQQIEDRISLLIIEKASIWDILKGISWGDFTKDFLDYLIAEKGYPSHDDPTTEADFATFLADYTKDIEGLTLPFYYGQLLHETNITAQESESVIILSLNDSAIIGIAQECNGGHWCCFFKTIFEYIENTYGVNFLTQDTTTLANIWLDTYAKRAFTPMRDIFVKADMNQINGTIYGYYFDHSKLSSTYNYYPLTDVKDKEDKTLFDCVNVFFQHFNLLQQTTYINGVETITMRRFDDLATLAPVLDFSKNITGVSTFKPSIDGYGQNNNIKFKSIYPQGDKMQGSRILTSLNKNTPINVELFEIPAYIPSFKSGAGGLIPDLSIEESFKEFQVFVYGASSSSIDVRADMPYLLGHKTVTAHISLKFAALYSLAGEYLFLDDIIKYPRYYTIKKWLTIRDILGIDFFNQFYIEELGASFFINKISGFNPEKSNEPTTLELIRISSKTPTTIVYPFNFYTDGTDVEYTDGVGNYYY